MCVCVCECEFLSLALLREGNQTDPLHQVRVGAIVATYCVAWSAVLSVCVLCVYVCVFVCVVCVFVCVVCVV